MNDPRDVDISTQSPTKEFVDTQTTHDILAGATWFEVHSMLGVVPGQILSIGWEGVDLEHFTVKALGSIRTVQPLRFDHAALSPIRLVRTSNASVPSGASGRPHTKERY